MGIFEKENWRGQELISKLALWSIIGIELFLVPLIDLLTDNTTMGVFVLFGLAFYLFGLAYASKSMAHRISKEFGGIRRWKCRYDLGRGRTGNVTFYIADMYPLSKAPQILREQVAQTKQIMFDVEQKVEIKEGQELSIDGLTLFEDLQSEKEHAIQELRERDITKKTESEYILDRMLEPYYKKEKKKDAFIKGKPTKEFEEWKNSDGKTIKVLQQEIKAQISELDKKQSQKDIHERKIRLIGEDLALRSTLGELIAADKGEPEGGAVHGYLKSRFENYHELLKKDQILDIAQEISKEIWIPKIAKVIKKIELTECVATVVELYEVTIFDHDPHLPFQKMVVFAQEPLEAAVDWKERVPKTIHYFEDIPVTNGYSNIIVPTRITHDTPMIFIAHSPGKDYYVRNLEIDEEEIKEGKEGITASRIADLEADIIEVKEKAEAHEKKEIKYRKITARISQENEIIHDSLFEEKMKRNKEREALGKGNIGKIILYILGIVVIIFLIVIILGVVNTTMIPTNSTRALSNSIGSYWKYIHIFGV